MQQRTVLFSILAICLLLTPAGLAQTPRMPFERLSLAQGLSQSVVTSMLQDRDGFLWLGTYDGLNRFDGYSFRIFKNDTNDDTSLANNYIECLAQDASGAIWVGTNGSGLDRYDPNTEAFEHLPHRDDRPESLGHNNVLSLLVDTTGRLWVGTGNGLDLYEPKDRTFKHFMPAFAGGTAGDELLVRALWQSPVNPDEIWLGTDRGLYHFDAASGAFKAFTSKLGDATSLVDNNIFCLFMAKSTPNLLWIGTDNGLSRFDTNLGAFTNYRHHPGDGQSISSNRIRSMGEDDKGSFWLGTDGGGLCRMDVATGNFESFANNPLDPASLSQNTVLTMLQDQSKTLWIGTSGGGLCKLDPRKAQFVLYRNAVGNPNSMAKNDVLSVMESRQDPAILWVGNQDGGLNRIDRRTGTVTHFINNPSDPNSLSHNSVFALYEDREGNVWAGTRAGLSILDRRNRRFTRYLSAPSEPKGLRNDNVTVITEDLQGRIWVGTRGGLSLYDKGTRSFINYRNFYGQESSLSNDNILSIAVSPESPDILWVGTADGLNRFNTTSGTVKRFYLGEGKVQQTAVNYCMAVYESPLMPGVIWVGTLDGLIRLDWRENRRRNYKPVLPAALIYSILPEDKGDQKKTDTKVKNSLHLWISTNNGLARFGPEMETCQPFGYQEGVEIADFNRGSAFVSPSGEMFFGGTLGMYAFHPFAIESSTFNPPVVFTSIRVMETEIKPLRPITTSGELRLRHEQNFVSIEFSALDFRVPQRIRYAYRMEGLDLDWIQRSADRRFVTYTDLRPGTYAFRVRSTNSDGVWSDSGATLRIVVDAPFWRTGGFLAFCTLLLATLIFAGHRFRLSNITKHNAELTRILAERTRDLQEAALRDPVTGLRNRRFLTEVVTDDVESFIRSKQYLLDHGHTRRAVDAIDSVIGVFVIDLDHFREVNEQHGHGVGDRLLVKVAKELLHSVRSEDMVIRLGSNEFLVILNGSKSDYIDVFARKVRASIEKIDLEYGEDPSQRLTSRCSVGYTTIPFYSSHPSLINLEHAISLADLGLYWAKNHGRNRAARIVATDQVLTSHQITQMLSSLEHSIAEGWLRIEAE